MVSEDAAIDLDLDAAPAPKGAAAGAKQASAGQPSGALYPQSPIQLNPGIYLKLHERFLI